MKATIHKGCSCRWCKRGRTKANRLLKERAYRRRSKVALQKGDESIHLNSVGYTD